MSRARDDRKRNERHNASAGICPSCGRKARHYVVPSLGEPGFYICDLAAEPFAHRRPEPQT